MTQLAMAFLGAFQVTLDGTPVTGFRSVKNQALLAYLAIEGDRPHTRAAIAGLLWPEEPEEAARQNLRQALFQLRGLLRPTDVAEVEFFRATPTDMQFNQASNYWLDVAELSTLLTACDTHEHVADRPCETCLARLAQAVELYRGPLLHGLFVSGSAPLEEWLLWRREALQHQVLTALYTLAAGYTLQGNHERAYHYAYRQIELDPLREEAYQQAMRALALGGQRSEALACYLTCSQALYDELGASPSAETESLFRQIESGALTPSVRMGYVDPAAAVAPKPQHNLPAATTPFIGRQEELTRLQEWLLDPACRQITLIGLGGVGKTRLTLQAAAAVVEAFAHGVWLTPLAGVGVETGLTTAIITALGLTPPKSDPLQFLLEYLADRELLLVLDNFEHIIGEANLVGRLLAHAPRLKLLVTSRTRLNLQAEMVMVVDGLPTPPAPTRGVIEDFAALQRYSSVQLFAERAQHSLLGFTLDEETLPAVAKICRLVYGLPLGIELAATWVDQFSCEELAEAIARNQDFLTTAQSDIPERQRSLRAVFEHSWQLINPEEQNALTHATVFHGAFNRDAALEVAQTNLPTLAGLTHKSLLMLVAPGRYTMHELVRQFAAETLQPAERAHTTRQRHSRYYLKWLARWENLLFGAENSQACARIQAELDNIRAAWRWAALNQAPALLAASQKAFLRFYVMAGLYREARDLLQLALDHLPAAGGRNSKELQARLLTSQAKIWFHLSNYPASAAAAQRALALAETTQNLQLQADSLHAQADAFYHQGEQEVARQTMAKALALAQQANAAELEADCQLGFGDMLMYLGDERVQPAHNRALTLYRQLGDRCGEAWTLTSMGIVAAFHKEYEPSRGFFEEALHLFQQLGDRPGVGRALNNLAAITILQKQYTTAEPILVQSLHLARENGYRLGEVQVLTNLAEALRGQGKRSRAQYYCEEALALARSLGHVRGEGIQLKILGELAYEDGDYAEAETCFTQAMTAARTQGDRYFEGERLCWLGQTLRQRGDWEGARAHLTAALATARQVKDEATEGKALAELALLERAAEV